MSIYHKFVKTSLATALLGASLMAVPAIADIVHLDDVIIDFSLCVGNDCIDGESFGFDTIRLKENNLRITFIDTSSSASFPSNDWQLTANDSSNGGLNKFSIDDITGGRTPFTIEAGAPSNSLYVDDGGRLGLGTSTPVVDAHIVTGNTPTLRLEQNGSSGFTPQTWDVAGNEAGFFIRDATNGSTLPFRIRPGAPSSAIAIEGTTGDVGFGTLSPDADIHIFESSGSENVTLTLENSGNSSEWQLVNRQVDGEFALNDNGTNGAEFIFTGPTGQVNGNTSIGIRNPTAAANWQLVARGVDGEFALNDNRVAGAEFIFRGPGAATPGLTMSGTLTTGGPTCGGGCDEVFDEDYNLPSIEEHAKAMYAGKYLPAVGPTIPKAPVNLTEQYGNLLNELEKAHIYIAQMHKHSQTLETRLVELEKRAQQ